MKACKGGVERSHIIPFALDGSLLLEVYVHDGIGTMVIDENWKSCARPPLTTWAASATDRAVRKDGTLVKRDRTEIERDIATYTVIEHDGVILVAQPLPYPEAKTAEMAAVTVSPKARARATVKSCSSALSSAPRHGAGQHLCADHPHHALVHQTRLSSPWTLTGCPMHASANTTGTAAARCW